ncbi:MAG: hypothetical protein U0Q16_31585 [Bryobacteraceae bacterium]
MKPIQRALAVVLAVSVISAQSASAADFCWKSSYGRGVGTIPGDCTFDQQKQGLLCYPKCKDGYTGFVASCFQNCPSGFTDSGAVCTKGAPYGRGAGYGWQIQDGFSNSGMLGRCQSAESRTCEMWGAMAYPTCKAGYSPVGANVCSPTCPSGMPDLGAACAKQSYVRDTISPQCAAGQVYDAGLCYSACKASYKGVGPVCWGGCPTSNPFQCGGGCAKDQATCAAMTADMVISTINMAITWASFALPGVGGVVTAAFREGLKEALIAAGKAAMATGGTYLSKQAVIQAVKESSNKAGVPIKDATVNTWGDVFATMQAAGAGSQADVDRANSVFNAIPIETLDITGMSAVVRSYTHPVCAAP